MLGIFLYGSLPYFLRLRLSLNLKIPASMSAKLASQQAPRPHLSPPPMLGLQACMTMSGFKWVLEIQAQALTWYSHLHGTQAISLPLMFLYYIMH